MPVLLTTPPEDDRRSSLAHSLRRRVPLASAVAAIGVAAVVASASAGPGLGLTEVTAAQPRVAGVSSPNYISPELVEFVQAQGSWVIDGSSPTDIFRYYAYLNDTVNPASTPLIGTGEAQKTEPDKNTYVVLKGLHGADANYSYGTHFLFQGHEAGPVGHITRINLDADPAHRVSLIATKDNLGNNIPVIDGSVWNPFSQSLLFSQEGNGTSTGGIWETSADVNSVAINRQGILGRGGYEGMQLDSDGNIWIVEDIGAAAPNTFSGAKQANSFVYRFIPKNVSNLGDGGRLQVLQADDLDGNPVTFGTPAASLADVNTTFMHDLHTYGNSFDTRWITIYDTATDGTAAFNANALAKSLGGTPLKRPENGQFRPGSKFGEFYFTETGDTSATSAANASFGGWGGVLKLDQKDPSANTGTLSPFYLGDLVHTGLDNIAFLDKDNIQVVEDAGDGLHGARGLDSGYILPIAHKGGTPTPFRFLAEGRDPSATLDASVTPTGFGRNETDNEITGIHLSDGDASVHGLIGTREPQFLNPDGRAHEGWRLFWTQQHGDNATYEVISALR